MTLQIEELLALQALDTEIGRLRDQIGTLDRGEKVERALEVRRKRLEAAERRLQGIEVEQRDAELDLKAIEDKKREETQRYWHGKITAPRELQALEAEIQMLERQRQRAEEQILKRMDELEAARKTAETARAAVDEAEQALAVLQRRYEKAAGKIESGLAEYEPERARLAAKLKPDTLRRYEEIRRRNHNVGAVRIENGACGGCRMKVGGAVLRRLVTTDTYVYCESCTRFLFPEAAKTG